jgi:hypothetical protein
MAFSSLKLSARPPLSVVIGIAPYLLAVIGISPALSDKLGCKKKSAPAVNGTAYIGLAHLSRKITLSEYLNFLKASSY